MTHKLLRLHTLIVATVTPTNCFQQYNSALELSMSTYPTREMSFISRALIGWDWKRTHWHGLNRWGAEISGLNVHGGLDRIHESLSIPVQLFEIPAVTVLYCTWCLHVTKKICGKNGYFLVPILKRTDAVSQKLGCCINPANSDKHKAVKPKHLCTLSLKQLKMLNTE